MTVYVDLLFGLNTVINYLMLRGSAAMGGCPVRRWRLFAAAVIGGLYAVAVVLPELETMQSLGCQLLCAVLMLLVAFGRRRNTVKQGLFFFALSFAFSGVVLLAVQLLEPDCVFLDGQAYYGVTMPALLLLAGLSYGLSAVVLAGWGAHSGGDLVTVKLLLGERRVELQALRDTGNTLRDPMTNQVVMVAGWSVLSQLLPEAGVTKAHLRQPDVLMRKLTGCYPKLRFRLIPYQAVGVETGLLLAVRCQLQMNKKKETVLVAFAPTEISSDGKYEALWGGAIR